MYLKSLLLFFKNLRFVVIKRLNVNEKCVQVVGAMTYCHNSCLWILVVYHTEIKICINFYLVLFLRTEFDNELTVTQGNAMKGRISKRDFSNLYQVLRTNASVT